MPHAEYNVTFHAGVHDNLQAGVAHLASMAQQARSPKVPEGYGDTDDPLDLATQRLHYSRSIITAQQHVIDGYASFVRSLVSSLLLSSRDGNVHLFPDGKAGVFFRYDSGYSGAMLPHGSDDAITFSVHT